MLDECLPGSADSHPRSAATMAHPDDRPWSLHPFASYLICIPPPQPERRLLETREPARLPGRGAQLCASGSALTRGKLDFHKLPRGGWPIVSFSARR